VADIDVVFRPPAREFYDHVATAAERLQIDTAVRAIRRAPEPDDRNKFTVSSAPGQVLFNDGVIWLIYAPLNAWTLEVLGAGIVG
jgi:hypothetical protein